MPDSYQPDFIDLVLAALLGQRAHISARDGSAPAHLMFAAGWRPSPGGPEPSGERLGWHLAITDSATVRLDPDVDLIAFIPEQLRRHTGVALYAFEETVARAGGRFSQSTGLDRLDVIRKTVVFQAALFGLNVVNADDIHPNDIPARDRLAGASA